MSQKKIKSIQTFIQNDLAMADFDYADSNGRYLASVKEFDVNDNILKEIAYRPDGWVENHYTNKFNEANKRIEHSIFDENDELMEKHQFDYDESGKIKGEACYYAEMDDSDYTHFVYNADGLLVEKNNMDSDNELYSYVRFEYDNKKLVNERHFNDDNRLELEKIIHYLADGKVSKEVDVDHIENDQRTYVYDYDEAGNRVKTLMYNRKDELIMKTLVSYNENAKRTELIEEDQTSYFLTKFFYDESGKMVVQEKFNNEEIILVRWEYTYEDDLMKLVEMYIREDKHTDDEDEEEFVLTKRITTEYVYEFFE